MRIPKNNVKHTLTAKHNEMALYCKQLSHYIPRQLLRHYGVNETVNVVESVYSRTTKEIQLLLGYHCLFFEFRNL